MNIRVPIDYLGCQYKSRNTRRETKGGKFAEHIIKIYRDSKDVRILYRIRLAELFTV